MLERPLKFLGAKSCEQKKVGYMLEGASILITGGTGSFGNAFAKHILGQFDVRRLIIFSRDEMKQWEMAQRFVGDTRIRFFIGDVRDRDRVQRAVDGVDYVIHAAATKIVPTAEYNPFECVKTNVQGAMNVIDACIDKKVKAVVALSTDKASSPINLYGATKLTSDKLFISANSYAGDRATKFAVVRYGNVMDSRGSVIPFFQSMFKSDELPITDKRMTRFMITLQEGIDLVLLAIQDSTGGEIYVKKIPSMLVTDIAHAINPNAKLKIIGVRPGEKIHEQMIGVEDAPHTFEYDGHYKILPAIYNWDSDPQRIGSGARVDNDFSYKSNNNTEWMSSQQLRDILGS